MDSSLNEWITDNILALKAIRRKNELIWRKTRITINTDVYYDSRIAVEKKNISKRKSELMEQSVNDCEDDQTKCLLLSFHLASSSITSAGSGHKCSGDNVVRIWEKLKR